MDRRTTNQRITARLTGTCVPPIALTATDGTQVKLSELDGLTVVYAYPRTSPPDQPAIEGWDSIPGARGCTPQSIGFATHHGSILAAGADRVYGLSTQKSNFQAELRNRLHLPFEILSDSELVFSDALQLPKFAAGGMSLLVRLTLVICNGKIERVFHPIYKPADNASDVLAFLQERMTIA